MLIRLVLLRRAQDPDIEEYWEREKEKRKATQIKLYSFFAGSAKKILEADKKLYGRD